MRRWAEEVGAGGGGVVGFYTLLLWGLGGGPLSSCFYLAGNRLYDTLASPELHSNLPRLLSFAVYGLYVSGSSTSDYQRRGMNSAHSAASLLDFSSAYWDRKRLKKYLHPLTSTCLLSDKDRAGHQNK